MKDGQREVNYGMDAGDEGRMDRMLVGSLLDDPESSLQELCGAFFHVVVDS